MSFQGFYTTKGLALAAKLAAGTKLTITKVTAGSGETAKSAAALAGEKQTLTAGTAAVNGQTAVLPVTLAEAGASAAYDLTELGVYAQDPEAGEILYQVFRLTEPAAIAAGGADTFRFYLRQTVGAAGVTVICSPAGLLIDEDLAPVREKVLAISAPRVPVTLAPSEVNAYIQALPRLLTKDLWLTITAGTVSQTLDFSCFYGPGRLWLRADTGAEVQLAGGVQAYFTRAEIVLQRLSVTGGVNVSGSMNAVYVYDSSMVYLNGCTVTAGSNARFGVHTAVGGRVYMNGGNLTGFPVAALAEHLGEISLNDVSASGNTTGAEVWGGGMILLAGSTPVTVGGSANVKSGGMIVKKDGTLL